jgi:mono/diheme cytochrome c family protein
MVEVILMAVRPVDPVLRMSRRWVAGAVLAWSVAAATAQGGLTAEQQALLPPAAARRVDFGTEIKPILERSCVKCHGRGKAKGGFSLEDRASLLRGGRGGAAVVSGRSAESYLIELVSGLDPDNVMPQKGSRLKAEQVSLLRAWIDQGAAWDASVSFRREPPLNLEPRRPELPGMAAATGSATNPVDRLLQPYYRGHGVNPPPTVDDATYVRRVYLDTIGLLPPPSAVARFCSDRRPGKHERLVDALLSDRRRYAEHWLTFWNDVLRNDYRGTGYIDEGRKQITGWLFEALVENKPFDEFVRELVAPAPGSEGFTKGILWRGVVNASQTPQMQAAQNLSQVFMGVNLKCASCHDSFINDWTLADAYGLAGVYSDEPLEMVRCDKPTGEVAPLRFLYPELGELDATEPKADRLRRLAQLMTASKNGRLSRTVVNRIWARFMGRGLVEPLDDMETPAWDQNLLDWLASDLAEHGYDLKRPMRWILTSRAYRLPSVPATEQQEKEFVFRGPLVRRITAEQFRDALATITDDWPVLPASEAQLSGVDRSQLGELGGDLPTPRWIWSSPGAAAKAAPGTVYFRKALQLFSAPAEAAVAVSADNRYRFLVNGKEVLTGDNPDKPKVADLRPHLVAGENILGVEVTNAASNPDDGQADHANPAGLVLYVRLRLDDPAEHPARNWNVDLVSDRSWRWSSDRADGWDRPGFEASGWGPAAEVGDLDAVPWHLRGKLEGCMTATAFYGQVRAALSNNDPFLSALGRPPREQVATSRPTAATTLQALELTNGQTLAGLLKSGAIRLTASHRQPDAGPAVVATVFEKALGRPPTGEERQWALAALGAPIKPEGVEDLLWAVTMLPEFQLIY